MATDDWRVDTLNTLRDIIMKADPSISETSKWIKASNPNGIPVWESNGIICTGETYKAVVKLTFMKGASLDDPSGLFNSSLEGATRRAIDVAEGDKINAAALKKLIKAAVALNASTKKK